MIDWNWNIVNYWNFTCLKANRWNFYLQKFFLRINKLRIDEFRIYLLFLFFFGLSLFVFFLVVIVAPLYSSSFHHHLTIVKHSSVSSSWGYPSLLVYFCLLLNGLNTRIFTLFLVFFKVLIVDVHVPVVFLALFSFIR